MGPRQKTKKLTTYKGLFSLQFPVGPVYLVHKTVTAVGYKGKALFGYN